MTNRYRSKHDFSLNPRTWFRRSRSVDQDSKAQTSTSPVQFSRNNRLNLSKNLNFFPKRLNSSTFTSSNTTVYDPYPFNLHLTTSNGHSTRSATSQRHYQPGASSSASHPRQLGSSTGPPGLSRFNNSSSGFSQPPPSGSSGTLPYAKSYSSSANSLGRTQGNDRYTFEDIAGYGPFAPHATSRSTPHVNLRRNHSSLAPTDNNSFRNSRRAGPPPHASVDTFPEAIRQANVTHQPTGDRMVYAPRPPQRYRSDSRGNSQKSLASARNIYAQNQTGPPRPTITHTQKYVPPQPTIHAPQPRYPSSSHSARSSSAGSQRSARSRPVDILVINELRVTPTVQHLHELFTSPRKLLPATYGPMTNISCDPDLHKEYGFKYVERMARERFEKGLKELHEPVEDSLDQYGAPSQEILNCNRFNQYNRIVRECITSIIEDTRRRIRSSDSSALLPELRLWYVGQKDADELREHPARASRILKPDKQHFSSNRIVVKGKFYVGGVTWGSILTFASTYEHTVKMNRYDTH